MNTIEISSAQTDEIYLFDADVHVLKEHLKSNQISQEMLDGYLLSGFQLVQRQIREMRQVALALKLLLQSGSKWRDGAVLENHMTPYHLICQATGDHDELLNMIINSSERNLLNNKSYDGSTALLYAVNNANLNCVRSLIANGAEVNSEYSCCLRCCTNQNSMQTLNLITAANNLVKYDSIYPSGIMSDIFDLLLDSGIDVNKPCSVLNCERTPIICAVQIGNVQCVRKLIEKGAWLDAIVYDTIVYDIIVYKLPVWSHIAHMGSVELIKCMLDSGIDKDSTAMECITTRSLFSFVVESGEVEAIRHLLDLGVSMPSYTAAINKLPCKKCGKNRLLIDTIDDFSNEYPSMIACKENMCNVVQLLDKYGNQNLKTMNALRCAVRYQSVDVVDYLLSRYTYQLNDEYFKEWCDIRGEYCTKKCHLLEEACEFSPAVVQSLLDHGADFSKTFCYPFSIIITAMLDGESEETVALLIRNGADINCRSQHFRFKTNVLPFDVAVEADQRSMAEMLLISGCSCGVFSLDNDHQSMYKVKPDIKDLMTEWNVFKNNVTPLEMQCRRVILKHLSPTAQKKIKKLPLPPLIIKYLSIPELDDLIYAYA